MIPGRDGEKTEPDTVSPGTLNGEGKSRDSGPARPLPPRLPQEPSPPPAPAGLGASDPGQVTGRPAHHWQEGRLDVKIKIRPEHASRLQMDDRPTGLRDGESARPVGPSDAEPGGPGPNGHGRAGRGYPPFSLAELEWHHDDPADQAHPRWKISGEPSR